LGFRPDSNQCPHTDKYAPLLENASNRRGIPLELVKINNRDAARNAPTPFPTYSFFLNGKFVTNEILTEKKFFQYLEAAEYL
jgi:thiol-disulfide isomerase/thioredoxin